MSKIPLSENRSPWVNEFGKFGVAHFHAGDICVFWSARPAAARPQSRHGPLLAWAARPVLCASPSLFSIEARAGGVAERSKAHAWKVCIRETVSRVRIPPPPPSFKVYPRTFGASASSPSAELAPAIAAPDVNRADPISVTWPASGSTSGNPRRIAPTPALPMRPDEDDRSG